MHHRLATLSDFDFIYRIYMDDVGNQYLTYDPMEQEVFKPIYKDLLATNTVYIVEEEGQPVCTYRLIPKQYRQAHTVYLGSLGIDPQHKGKGYGFAILEEIKENARRQGRTRIELTVDLDNDAAVHLYKKVGFVIEGVVRHSYKLSTTNQFYDEYLMAVLL